MTPVAAAAPRTRAEWRAAFAEAIAAVRAGREPASCPAFLSVRGVAELTEVSPAVVRAAIARGELDRIAIGVPWNYAVAWAARRAEAA